MWWLEPTFNGKLLAVAADDVPSIALLRINHFEIG